MKAFVLLTAAFLASVGIGLGALAGANGTNTSSQPSALVHAPGGPRFTVVDTAALKGYGNVAYISLGDLFVVDGETGKVLNVTGQSAAASDPQFSPNGAWLTYATDNGGTFWLAQSDGQDSRKLAGEPTWLPNGQLVLGVADSFSTYSLSASGTLRRTGGNAQAHEVSAGSSTAFVFVTNSMNVNPAKSSSGIEEVETASTPNGPRTLWYKAAVSFTPAGGLQGHFPGNVTVLPNHRGLLLTIQPFCCDYADGYALYELRSPGSQPQSLGMVLISLNAPSYGPDGTFALGAGGNRYAWVTEHVELCDEATARCTVLSTPKDVLSLSPAWSPNEQTLAFVEARAETEGAIGQPQIAQWYATHHLYLLSSGSKTPVEVPDTQGAAAPVWSAHSKTLMFVKNDDLFLISHRGATPVEIAGPLFTPGAWGGYYGELDWNGQFAWSAS